MRYSQLFGKTKLTAPHDADSANARLLTQAGFVDKLAAGIYNFLPLGLRVLQKVNAIIRDEMNKVGGQEIAMPALHPIEIWNTTGRNQSMDEILYRTKGAGGKDFVFGPSHEETVTPLAAKFVQSHKDLPFAVYQVQTKFRNEARAKSGILRGREFGMKDMYSFHKDEADLDKYYEEVKQAYTNVYKRCGMTSYVVEASGGAFTTNLSHEFSIVTPAGEDTIIICKKCDIAQNLEIAEGKVHDPSQPEEKELPMKEVPITRGASVTANAQAHNVPEWKILKTVVYKVDDGFLGVAIRGDLQINENKLTRYLGKNVRACSPAELAELGLVIGFISPVGEPKVKGGPKHAAEVHAGLSEIALPFIADHSIRNVKNFVTGANKKDVDLVNVNLGRDFTISDFTDLVAVEKGFKCAKCGSELHEEKAIEAGNIFKLGTRYSKDCELYFTDDDGKRKLVIMGCYGIGNTRLVGTIAEASHDDKGLIWPKAVAPYHVHLLSVGFDKDAKKEAESLYKKLVKAGVEVLYDDRDESAGKKFNDADIIGIPLRVVVSERTLKEGAAEFKLRTEKEGYRVPIKDAAKAIKEFVNS
jgi:prolyl-tRNA synthetase